VAKQGIFLPGDGRLGGYRYRHKWMVRIEEKVEHIDTADNRKPAMKYANRLRIILVLAAIALGGAASAQMSIPPGTILPVELKKAFSSNSKAGETITARIMQDVPLPEGRKIPIGSTVIGKIVAVEPGPNGQGVSVKMRFDEITTHKATIPVTTSLRAVANMMEVDQAQIPIFGADRGTSRNAWTTVQVGGDAVYRGGGQVKGESGWYGKPVYPDGVEGMVTANPDWGCDAGNNRPQALWVFSSNACGMYGFSHEKIGQHGNKPPLGEIVVTSTKDSFNVRNGSGLLLEVVGNETQGR
jgi:hypothetical protein